MQRTIFRSVLRCATVSGLALTLIMLMHASLGFAADSACPIIQLPGQCVCHNFESILEERCPSESGIENGHDCHVADYCCFPDPLDPAPDYCNFPTLDCTGISSGGVRDTLGKCNGCGDGVFEIREGCCDPDTDESCTDPNDFCEECDDGSNVSGTNNCDANCQLEACGNDIIDLYEQCDGNALGDCELCSDDCQCCPDANADGVCDACRIDEDCPGVENNLCIESYQCLEGSCVAQPTDCNDGNICTDSSCDAAQGCINTPNQETLPCYTGPAGTENVGTCTGGTRTCTLGELSDCTGEVTPVSEICDDGLDNDCNGEIDQPGCAVPSESMGATVGGCSLIR